MSIRYFKYLIGHNRKTTYFRLQLLIVKQKQGFFQVTAKDRMEFLDLLTLFLYFENVF